MVNMTLDERLITDGEKLLQQLDSSQTKVDAALWFYFSDIASWKLLLSLPDLIGKGPKAAYQKVQAAFSELARKGIDISFALNDVAIAQPSSPLLRLLRVAIRTGSEISGIRFANNVINGQLIEDAYIYRLI